MSFRWWWISHWSSTMPMVSKPRRSRSFSIGRMSEARFVKAAERLGLDVKKSSPREDMHEHIDYWLAIEETGSKWCVDVKGNNLPNEIWCEFKNVQGKPGWLYGGASIIAFDMPEEGGFCIVDRKELSEWCESVVEDVKVQNKADAYKKKYTRKDRLDEITKVNLNDIKQLDSYRVWEYERDY